MESHLSRKERAKDGAPSICGLARVGQMPLHGSRAGCTIRGQLIRRRRDRLGRLNAFLSKRNLLKLQVLFKNS